MNMSNKEKHTSDKATEELLKAAEKAVNEEAEQEQESGDTDAGQTEPSGDDKVQELGEKLAELNDKYLRLYSEYENYRKRTSLEKADLLVNGSREMMKAILPVIDDFERALDATNDEGVRLIYNKFVKALEGLGVKEIETKDADFNTDVHEAVAMVPGMGDDKKGKVIDCLQKGYQLNDKVIRHAKVAVGQ
jgi:molecular chaperone GrpE